MPPEVEWGDGLKESMKVVRLRAALEWIAYEAGQYADGAEDSHYLARFLCEVEAVAREALK